MRRAGSRIWISLAAVFVVILGTLAIAPRFVDWSQWRDDIAGTVGTLAGRAVAIDGGVRLTLLPIPSLVADGVRLGEAAGGRAPYFARVGQLEARLDLAQLLVGKIAVTSLVFINPEVDLVDRLDGLLPDSALPVEQVRFVGGSLGLPWFEEGERLTRFDGEVVFNADGKGWRITGDFHHRSLPWHIEAALSPGPTSAQLGVQLGARGGGPTLRLTGQVKTDTGAFSGRLRGDGDRASELFFALGLPAPQPAKGRLTLDAKVEGDNDIIRLEGLTAALSDQRFQGDIKLDWTGENPVLVVELATSRLDVEAWQVNRSPALAPRKGNIRIDGRIDAKADTVEWNNGFARAATFKAALSGDILTVTEAHAQLPGSADVAGSGTFDLAAPHGFTARIEGGADDPRPALTWLGVTLPIPEGRLRRVSAVADLSGDQSALDIRGIDLAFDGSRLTGDISLRRGDRKQATLALHIDRLNIDAYLSAPDLSGPEPLAWMTDWDGSARITVDAATLKALPVPNMRLQAKLDKGIATLERLEGGTLSDVYLTLGGSIDRSKWPAVVDLRGDISLPDTYRVGQLLEIPLPGVLGRPLPFKTALSLNGPANAARIALAPAWGKVQGQVLGPLDLIARTGRVDVEFDSASSIAVLAQLGDIARRNDEIDTPASLRGVFSFGPGRWELREIKAVLADLAASGQVGLHEGKYIGGLGVSALHVDGWGGPLTTGNDLNAWIKALPESQIALRFGSIDAGNIGMNDVSATLETAPGTLSLGQITGKSFDGQGSGKLTLTAGDEQVSLDGALEIKDANLATLGGVLFQDPEVAGRLTLTGTAKSQGGSLLSLWRGLKGEAGLFAGEGKLPGFDIAVARKATEAADNEERNSALVFSLGGGVTSFKAGKGRIEINDGVARLLQFDLSFDGGNARYSGAWPLAGGPLVGQVRYDLDGLPPYGFQAEGQSGRWSRRVELPK
ncbi:AsmA family protein [Lacibacterium aquatile]|uniref:AsmA family protein n=1 Tax=Lacibacterium aquatile TaxID=1168082 RepID=A0ABW5DS03_9PROT